MHCALAAHLVLLLQLANMSFPSHPPQTKKKQKNVDVRSSVASSGIFERQLQERPKEKEVGDNSYVSKNNGKASTGTLDPRSMFGDPFLC